eukprot:CAMPEP_0114607064 /NCGR_PEP_ID=MMETSP0168-20121206/1879_1 /TAXON_ID=95228 ORGANISM="Vannella sp., Strain DIVA3 517/6/12" /NCGR_SAMPLE_ID=MMETSP0168 /ASSEMBLY_ACC=CAM_ASM_000044 /LENGTH=173 /DNA_ID=CAMNT_0001817937 /DNA_START=92 /DNA_END=611 /DNA_ORIENTATION=-
MCPFSTFTGIWHLGTLSNPSPPASASQSRLAYQRYAWELASRNSILMCSSVSSTCVQLFPIASSPTIRFLARSFRSSASGLRRTFCPSSLSCTPVNSLSANAAAFLSCTSTAVAPGLCALLMSPFGFSFAVTKRLNAFCCSGAARPANEGHCSIAQPTRHAPMASRKQCAATA